MFEKITKIQLVILSVILGLALIYSTVIVSRNVSKNEITVTGSAFELVESDSGKWDFGVESSAPNKLQAYKNLERDVEIVKEFLVENGIKQENIEENGVSNWEKYKRNSMGNITEEVASYVYSKAISVSSDDVELIKKVYQKSPSLIEKGVNISGGSPQYYYSKLAEKKLVLLEEATLDAKKRAQGMLKATHNRVGKIRSVRMGVFQITPADSNEVSDWGINDSSTIKKKITAVANVVFMVK